MPTGGEMIQKLKTFPCFIAKRLCERSTLGDIGAGIAMAFAVPSPANFVAFAFFFVKALIPDGHVVPGASK
jgi:hypothetical protein